MAKPDVIVDRLLDDITSLKSPSDLVVTGALLIKDSDFVIPPSFKDFDEIKTELFIICFHCVVLLRNPSSAIDYPDLYKACKNAYKAITTIASDDDADLSSIQSIIPAWVRIIDHSIDDITQLSDSLSEAPDATLSEVEAADLHLYKTALTALSNYAESLSSKLPGDKHD